MTYLQDFLYVIFMGDRSEGTEKETVKVLKKRPIGVGVVIYLAGAKANSREFILHFQNTRFLPLRDPSFWIWLFSIWPPKLLIKQAPLHEEGKKEECVIHAQ